MITAPRPHEGDGPRSWDDVESCTCQACLALCCIYQLCTQAEEYLYVQDTRMHNGKFVIADIRKLFTSEPAVLEDLQYDEVQEAAKVVLSMQEHCEGFLSSFPHIVEDAADYVWRREDLRSIGAPSDQT